MSKALLKSSVKPKLIHRFADPVTNRAIEIWTTTCIVSNFHFDNDDNDDNNATKPTVLINPSNPQLTGVSNFPYFPRGGPVPEEKPMSMHKDWQPLGFVSSWGGMEVGTGMLFPVSVVDGLVHQHGGWRLQAECALKQKVAAAFGSTGDACPIGDAVVTSAGTDLLKECYDWVVHTTPPFYKFHKGSPEEALLSCYRNAFALGFEKGDRVATTLIGSGARGFPPDQAIHVAAEATQEWYQSDANGSSSNEQALMFGLLEQTHADKLIKVLEEK